MFDAPEGYMFLNLPDNPFDSSCTVLACDGCGCLVGNNARHVVAHNEWHAVLYEIRKNHG